MYVVCSLGFCPQGISLHMCKYFRILTTSKSETLPGILNKGYATYIPSLVSTEPQSHGDCQRSAKVHPPIVRTATSHGREGHREGKCRGSGWMNRCQCHCELTIPSGAFEWLTNPNATLQRLVGSSIYYADLKTVAHIGYRCYLLLKRRAGFWFWPPKDHLFVAPRIFILILGSSGKSHVSEWETSTGARQNVHLVLSFCVCGHQAK